MNTKKATEIAKETFGDASTAEYKKESKKDNKEFGSIIIYERKNPIMVLHLDEEDGKICVFRGITIDEQFAVNPFKLVKLANFLMKLEGERNVFYQTHTAEMLRRKD